MKVLVCGGRDYKNKPEVFRILDEINISRSITEIIHGGATGADMIAGEWARSRDIYQVEFPVKKSDWNTHGKRAGYLRNKKMLDEGKPDYVVAFPGGKGTLMMVNLAIEAKVLVMKAPVTDRPVNAETGTWQYDHL